MNESWSIPFVVLVVVRTSELINIYIRKCERHRLIFVVVLFSNCLVNMVVGLI